MVEIPAGMGSQSSQQVYRLLVTEATRFLVCRVSSKFEYLLKAVNRFFCICCCRVESDSRNYLRFRIKRANYKPISSIFINGITKTTLGQGR